MTRTVDRRTLSPEERAERTDQVASMWRAGVAQRTIADETGLSVGIVAGEIKRIRAAEAPDTTPTPITPQVTTEAAGAIAPTADEPWEPMPTTGAAKTQIAASTVAEEIDHELRSVAHTIADSMIRFKQLIEQAKTHNVHEALGFKSWVAYIVDVISTSMGKLNAFDRRQIVALLMDEDISSRAIAAAVGFTHPTILADKDAIKAERQVVNDLPPEPAKLTGLNGIDQSATKPKRHPQDDEPCLWGGQPDLGAPNVLNSGAENSAPDGETEELTVLGADGKTYPATKPKPNTMLAADLHRLLHNGLLFVSKDDTLPMIAMVRLEFGTDQVISIATDRFTIGVTHADYHGAEMVIQLSRTDAETLARIAKSTLPYAETTWQRLATVGRTVDIDHTEGSATFTFRAADGAVGETLTIELVGENFPNFRHLIPSEPSAAEHQHVRLDPALLAAFTKVIDTNRPRGAAAMTMTLQEPDRAVLINIGDSFVGALMPVRLGDSGFERPNWLGDAAVVNTQKTAGDGDAYTDTTAPSPAPTKKGTSLP